MFPLINVENRACCRHRASSATSSSNLRTAASRSGTPRSPARNGLPKRVLRSTLIVFRGRRHPGARDSCTRCGELTISVCRKDSANEERTEPPPENRSHKRGVRAHAFQVPPPSAEGTLAGNPLPACRSAADSRAGRIPTFLVTRHGWRGRSALGTLAGS